MSKKLPIYFSDDAWSSLQQIMGPEGKPSPTINAILEQIQNSKQFANKKEGKYSPFYLELLFNIISIIRQKYLNLI